MNAEGGTDMLSVEGGCVSMRAEGGAAVVGVREHSSAGRGVENTDSGDPNTKAW